MNVSTNACIEMYRARALLAVLESSNQTGSEQSTKLHVNRKGARGSTGRPAVPEFRFSNLRRIRPGCDAGFSKEVINSPPSLTELLSFSCDNWRATRNFQESLCPSQSGRGNGAHLSFIGRREALTCMSTNSTGFLQRSEVWGE